MALTFHHIDKAAADRLRVETDDGVPAFRTREGETIEFDGATRDEIEAKAQDFLTWAA
jgi:hypothetical protein